jgi:hypothetical protein
MEYRSSASRAESGRSGPHHSAGRGFVLVSHVSKKRTACQLFGDVCSAPNGHNAERGVLGPNVHGLASPAILKEVDVQRNRQVARARRDRPRCGQHASTLSPGVAVPRQRRANATRHPVRRNAAAASWLANSLWPKRSGDAYAAQMARTQLEATGVIPCPSGPKTGTHLLIEDATGFTRKGPDPLTGNQRVRGSKTLTAH